MAGSYVLVLIFIFGTDFLDFFLVEPLGLLLGLGQTAVTNLLDFILANRILVEHVLFGGCHI